ncbi:MAG: AcrR family transcriptional regulator [Myxococcota bacterium]|jgi:AcrR family transcriptional regulator
MNYLSPQAKETHTTILDVALHSFAQTGFSVTSTRAIATRAGVTQPLINHYFGSKVALCDALIESLIEQYDNRQSVNWQRDTADPLFFTAGLAVLFHGSETNALPCACPPGPDWRGDSLSSNTRRTSWPG